MADLAEWTNPGSYASISTGESHLVDECMPAWVTMQIVEQRVLFHLTQFRSILLVRAFWPFEGKVQFPSVRASLGN